MTDLYAVLQIDRHAEPEVVRAAFRALAQKYHPDSGGDRARMISIVEAWSILGDVRRRESYDRGLAAGTPGSTVRADPTPEAERQAQPAKPPPAKPPPATPPPATPPPATPPPAAPPPASFAASSASGSFAHAPSPETRPAEPDANTIPPPPGRRPSDGATLDFGRYAGWAIGQLARHDPNYLEWLRRTPIGRPYSAEIERILDGGPAVAVPTPLTSRGWRSRRAG